MSNKKSNEKTNEKSDNSVIQIVVATIALVSAISVAVLYNSDKLFPKQNNPETLQNNSQVSTSSNTRENVVTPSSNQVSVQEKAYMSNVAESKSAKLGPSTSRIARSRTPSKPLENEVAKLRNEESEIVKVKPELVQPELPTSKNLIGNWKAVVNEFGTLQEINLTLNDDGTMEYFFRTAEGDGEIHYGTWQYFEGLLYEKWETESVAKLGKGSIKWYDNDNFDLTIKENGHPVYTDYVRNYRRVKNPVELEIPIDSDSVDSQSLQTGVN